MTTRTGIMDLTGSGKDLAEMYETRVSGPTGTTHYLSQIHGKDLGSIFYLNASLGGLGLTGAVGANCGHKLLNGTDLGSLFCLKGTVASAFVLISDGSSLTGWTNSGITISATTGNPAPSFQTNSNNKYAYINATNIIPGLTTFFGRTLKFDIYTTSTNLVDFYFACNSSGAGNMFRLEGRSQYPSGLTDTYDWSRWNSPSAGPFALPTSIWYSIVITISSAGVATYTYNGTSFVGSYTISDSGTFIGVQADGLGGGNIDNIYISG